jgi:crotonobetainyl-CoA:carnitine CoA-transferase CaiB-like acyl-CoA transferase
VASTDVAAASTAASAAGAAGPLVGVKVIEMCQMISGPLGAQVETAWPRARAR